jgi:hypothetical protein
LVLEASDTKLFKEAVELANTVLNRVGDDKSLPARRE